MARKETASPDAIAARPPIEALIAQFLFWVAQETPTQAQVLDAWPSSCPRLSVWEDALLGGLVAFDGSRERHVVLTGAGRQLLRERYSDLLK